MKQFNKIIITLLACIVAGILSVLLLHISPLIILTGLICVGFMLAIFRDPRAGLFLIAFLLPFERIGSFELVGVTIRASQIFALLTIIAWILIFFTKRINFSAKNPLIIPMFLLTGFSIISIINAPNTQRAIIIFCFNLFVMLVSVMLPNLIKNKETLNKVLGYILISCFLVTIFGVYQFLGDMVGLSHEITGLRQHYTQEVFGFPRIQSTALEPLYFANYLLIPIALGIAIILGKRKKEDKLPLNLFWIFIITGLACINLILTLSRGGFLGLLVILLLSAVLFIKSILKPQKIIIIILLSAIAITSAFQFLKFSGDDDNIDTFIEQATTFNKGVGVEERFSTYDQAIAMIKRHPIIGNGVGNFGPIVNRSPYHMPRDGWTIVNNEFLELWAEVGLLGLISFLAMIVIIIIRTIKAVIRSTDPYLKTVLLGMTIAFLGIMAQYQTFSILYILHIWFLVGLIIATQNIIFKKQKINTAE
jgi:O-antigen ligase